MTEYLVFKTAWDEHLSQHETTWQQVKSSYPIGRRVIASLSMFYPQGAIVLAQDDSVLCIVDFPWEKWSPNDYRISAVVGSYDDDNQWLVLTDPKAL